MCRVLVTGGSGQVGRALRERVGRHRNIQLVYPDRSQLDLLDRESIETTFQDISPDIVVNAAAYTAVDEAEDQPQLAMQINGIAPGWLAQSAKKIGAKFLQVSTDYVFDGSKGQPYVESDAVNPQSNYGRSKLKGEQAARRELPSALIVRTSWVFSPFGRNFAKTMVGLAESLDILSVVDDQLGNPTSAHDLASALLTIVERWHNEPQLADGQTFHCTGTGQATWWDFARQVLQTASSLGGPTAQVKAIPSRDWPTKAPRPPDSRLNCEKMDDFFGWRAPLWRESVDHVVRRLLTEAGGSR